MNQQKEEHGHMLDVREPAKWQTRLCAYLETLEPADAEIWIEQYRLMQTVASRHIRDQVSKRVTRRCYVCNKPFKQGQPAGEAFYFDFDGQCVKVFCCSQGEYPQLLQMAGKKDDQRKEAEERAEKAAQRAAREARQAVKA